MTFKSLIPTKAPRLPAATKEYEQTSTDAFMRVLNLYFAQLDNALFGLLGRLGGKYLSNPYGGFSNSTTQAVTAANTTYVVSLNTTDAANGITLATNKMTVAQAGIYNVHYCLQFENTSAQITEVFVWLRKNGVDVPKSASSWSVTSTHASVNGYMLGTANFFVELAASDYLEVAVAASATGLNIEAYAASVSPFTRPSIPSSVVTVSFVSAPAS